MKDDEAGQQDEFVAGSKEEEVRETVGTEEAAEPVIHDSSKEDSLAPEDDLDFAITTTDVASENEVAGI